MTQVKLPFLLPVFSTFLSENCAKDFSNLVISVFCLKIFISKVVGYGIILGSIAVKLPQIFKILNSKSSKGISFLGQTLELIGVSSTVAYSISHKFPFSSYGEGVFLALQTSMIAMLTLYYQRSKSLGFIFLGIYGAIMSYLCSPLASEALLKLLIQINIPIVALGKLSQAWINFKNKSTGQLSSISVGLIFAGSVARIFTTIQETGDLNMALTFVIAAFCNLILVLQLVIYWDSKGVTKPRTKGKNSGDKKSNSSRVKPKKM